MLGYVIGDYEDEGELYDRPETDACLTLNETELVKSEEGQSNVNSLVSVARMEPIPSLSLVSLNKHEASLDGSILEIESINNICFESEATGGVFVHSSFCFNLSFLQYFKEKYFFLSPSIFKQLERLVNEFFDFNRNVIQPSFQCTDLPDEQRYLNTKLCSSDTLIDCNESSARINFATEPLSYASAQGEKQKLCPVIIEIGREYFEKYIELLEEREYLMSENIKLERKNEYLRKEKIELERENEYLRKENLKLKKEQEELLEERNNYDILIAESSKITSKL